MQEAEKKKRLIRSPVAGFSPHTQALQAAVQKIHAYVASLEEKMDAMDKGAKK